MARHAVVVVVAGQHDEVVHGLRRLAASSSTVNGPLLVTISAVYVFAGSMHIGGGSANCCVGGAEPSAGGQGFAGDVAPDVVGGTVVVAGGTSIVGTVAAARRCRRHRPMSSDSRRLSASATTTMRPMRITFLRAGAATLLALQLVQACLAVRLLAFPLVGAHGGGKLRASPATSRRAERSVAAVPSLPWHPWP